VIKRIFVDIDDVLNKFTMPALYHVNCGIDSFNYDEFPVECGFDIVLAANKLRKQRGMFRPFLTKEEFWNRLDQNFWATVPLSDEAALILEICSKCVGKDNIYLLSSISSVQGPDAIAGKMEWVSKHLPLWIQEKFLFGPPKHVCANESSLLIDDADANIELFKKNGGSAILFPRPWNSLNKTSTNSLSYFMYKIINTRFEKHSE